jgi:hypothetical protein
VKSSDNAECDTHMQDFPVLVRFSDDIWIRCNPMRATGRMKQESRRMRSDGFWYTLGKR